MFRRRQKRPPRGEFPPSFTRSFLRQTLPTSPPAEARAVLEHLRRRGWSEEQIAEQVLPYLPPPGSPLAREASPLPRLPTDVSTAWLDQHLPAMDRDGIRSVVEELERRGWTAADAAVAALPHLLPKLPPEDAEAILSGLKEIGIPAEDIARLSH